MRQFLAAFAAALVLFAPGVGAAKDVPFANVGGWWAERTKDCGTPLLQIEQTRWRSPTDFEAYAYVRPFADRESSTRRLPLRGAEPGKASVYNGQPGTFTYEFTGKDALKLNYKEGNKTVALKRCGVVGPVDVAVIEQKLASIIDALKGGFYQVQNDGAPLSVGGDKRCAAPKPYAGSNAALKGKQLAGEVALIHAADGIYESQYFTVWDEGYGEPKKVELELNGRATSNGRSKLSTATNSAAMSNRASSLWRAASGIFLSSGSSPAALPRYF